MGGGRLEMIPSSRLHVSMLLVVAQFRMVAIRGSPELPLLFEEEDVGAEFVSFIGTSLTTGSKGDVNVEKYEDDLFDFATGQRATEPTEIEEEVVSRDAPFEIAEDVLEGAVSKSVRDKVERRNIERVKEEEESEDRPGVFGKALPDKAYDPRATQATMVSDRAIETAKRALEEVQLAIQTAEEAQSGVRVAVGERQEWHAAFNDLSEGYAPELD